ncbi:FAD-dependent oxidoreductase [Geodermatophilus sp. URMC 62]|uniref:FAD-dependent oxidoreductase n=1 Tax=Geodermatophilus sp. URMC 62 TaxID=3423414 RepID=UPI00406D4FB3
MTSTRVTGFLRESDRIAWVRVRDLEGGGEYTVRAQQVVNAAGIRTDEIQEMVGGRGQFQVRASKGVHLVVPRNRINSATGIITRTEKSLLFVIPWGAATGSPGPPTPTGTSTSPRHRRGRPGRAVAARAAHWGPGRGTRRRPRRHPSPRSGSWTRRHGSPTCSWTCRPGSTGRSTTRWPTCCPASASSWASPPTTWTCPAW